MRGQKSARWQFPKIGSLAVVGSFLAPLAPRWQFFSRHSEFEKMEENCEKSIKSAIFFLNDKYYYL
jgi:hypothetical protein